MPNFGNSNNRTTSVRGQLLQRLTRLKLYNDETIESTELKRCLNGFDLTALGVGSTLGTGIYVVTGQVARQYTGPSVVVAFAIAAFASVLAGLCYAEFSARVPKTGSAYVFSYVTVGEFIAFIIGWNLILEYVIGTASVARAWSANFDYLVDHKISQFFLNHTSMDIPGLSRYPDFFSLLITLLLTAILVIGVKESSLVNNIFTTINLMVVVFVIGAGFFYANIANWEIPLSEVPDPIHNGHGGFFPFGFAGLLSGAASCFYAFVGFDAVATACEEVINPQRVIPYSIIISLIICFLAYAGVSAVITLMCPYYLLDPKAPLPQVFAYNHLPSAHYVISIGAFCGLSTSLLGAMFPLPRVVYAMANDGLLFRFLAKVNQRFKTPIYATLLAGLLAGLMATFFDLAELVNMMSIGTLLAYSLVALCVLILRYQPDGLTVEQMNMRSSDTSNSSLVAPTTFQYDSSNHNLNASAGGQDSEDNVIAGVDDDALLLLKKAVTDEPTESSGKLVTLSIVGICVFMVSLNSLIVFGVNHLINKAWWAILLCCILIFGVLMLTIFIYRQPQNPQKLGFKVKFLPFLPIISVYINTFLMLKLPYQTWIRFGIWMAVGLLVYFGYGMWFSTEERQIMEMNSNHAINDDPEISS